MTPQTGHAQSGPAQALVLDGQDDAVTFEDVAPFNFTGSFTIAFWVQADEGFGAAGAPLLTKGSDHWAVRQAGTSGRIAFVTGHGTASRDTLRGLTIVDDADGAWHHVAVVYDAVAGEKELYVDGVSEGASTVSGSLTANSDSVRLGTGPNKTDYFGGQIDDLRFWAAARSQEQIQHTLWHPLAGTEANLLAYYPADQLVTPSGTARLPDRAGDVQGRVEGTAALATTETPQSLSAIRATDDLYEDRVELSWPTPAEFAPASALLRVTRNDSVLVYRSTYDSTYVDEQAGSDVAYTYCLEVETQTGTYTYDCDAGQRSLDEAVDVAASDEQYTDQIEITWEDRSMAEAGYRLYRNGTPIATLDRNTRRYVDADSSALVPRTDYEYCVAPYDADGEGTKTCDVGRLAEVVPAASFAATTGQYDDQVALSWSDDGTGTTGFTIMRQDTSGVDAIAALPPPSSSDEIASLTDPARTTYTDTSATPGEAYRYCVIRQEGGIASTPACAVGSAGTMEAPANVSATDETFDDQVRVEWEDEAEVEDAYLVYRQAGDRTSDPDTTAMTPIATLEPDALSYTDTDAEPGQPYTYCVVATAEEGGRTLVTGVDSVGRPVDACDIGTRSVVLAPDEVTATDSTAEDQVTITWSDPATRSSLHRIYRRPVGDTTFAPIATPAGPVTEYVDETARPNTRHEYCVTALTGRGRESDRTCDFGSREVLKPTGVTATNDEFEDRVRVEWSDASSVEVGYRIYRRLLADDGTPATRDSTLLHTTARNEVVLLDTTGTPGRDYRYSVEAIVRFDGDTLSTSPGTNTGRRTLEAPTRAAATDGGAEAAVTVTWRDNSGAEDGYRLWRVSPAGDTTRAGETESNVTTFTDDGASLEVRYTYLVAAFDAHGTSETDTDEGFTEILAPGSVSASDSYVDTVTVSWVDRSSREAGYQVLRDGQVIAETGPNVTTIKDAPGGALPARYCVKAMSAEAGMSKRVCDQGDLIDEITGTEGREVRLEETLYSAGGPTGKYLAAGVRGITPTVLFNLGEDAKSVVLEREDEAWNEVDQVQGGDRGVHVSDGVLATADTNTIRRYEPAPDADGWKVDETFTVSGNPDTEVVEGVAMDSVRMAFALNSTGGTTDDRVVTLGAGGDTTVVAADSALFSTNSGSIALDGDLLAVRGTNDNQVRLYQRDNTNEWSPTDTVRTTDLGIASNAQLGQSLALSGNRLVVGVPKPVQVGSGAVFIFDVESGGIPAVGSNQVQVIDGDDLVASSLNAALPSFGESLTVGADGSLLVDAPDADQTHLFLIDEEQEGYRQNFVFRSEQTPYDRRGVGIAKGQYFVGTPKYNSYGDGRIYYFSAVASPGAVAASDGTQNDRVDLEWQNRSEEADGYRIYRNGREIATVGPDETAYQDADADPGTVSQFCVSAFSSEFGFETQLVCDQGWRAPDGSIAGTVQRQDGTGFEGVDVCLTPNPNSSLLFDGTGGYTITDDLTADVPGTFTIEVWVRPESGSGTAPVWAFAEDGPENRLVYDHGDRTFRYINGSGSVSSAHTFAGNEWHHVTVAVDSTTGEGTLYVNGQQEATFTAGPSPVQSSIFVLGQNGNLDGFWEGQIDEVRLWSTVRRPTEIDSLRNQPLTGTEDDLLAYWPLDERDGQAAANIVSEAGAYYAEYRNGVSPAREGAPIEACVRTDADGNYTHDRLRYGSGTEFTVDPEKPPHTFRPGRSAVTVNAGTPVENQVTFTDQTSLPVSGTIQYADTECPVQNVEIKVDDQMEGTTDSKGAYNVGVLPGEHTIAPVLDGENVTAPHSFEPEQQTVEVRDAKTGINFADTTTKTLTVEARGGCGFSVGIAEVKIRSTNGCLDRTVETDSTGMLTQDLPPQEYTIQVTGVRDVPDPTQKPKIERFFQQQGAYTVDLSESADTTLELIYRAPITAQVNGWPAGASCNNIDVPVLERNEELDLDLKVVEDYGDGNLCPADSTQITVYDELPDKADEPVTFTTDSTGTVDYHTFARTPNLIEGRVVDGVDRSYQKSLTMVAEAGPRNDQTTRWAIAEGTQPRKGTRFVTEPVDFPITVLRDPPGDQSFSYIEKGSEICNTVMGGAAFESTTSVGFKGGFSTGQQVGWWPLYQRIEIEGTATAATTISVGLESESSLSTCLTATERLETSDDPSAIGRPADVFLGAGINFVFSTSDVLRVDGEDESTCNIERSQTTSFRPDSISTTFAYTRGHVEGTMIPTLRQLEETSNENRIDYDAAIRMWNHILYQSDSLASASEPVTNDNYEDISLDENVSFNGGADYEYQHSESYTSTVSSSGFISIARSLDVVLGPEEPVTSQFLFSQELKNTVTFGSSREEGSSTLWGFVLSDGDGGDNYTVDVKKDPVYGTPVFDTRSGQSSCPYEPWRKPFDNFSSFEQDREAWKDYEGDLLTTRRDKAEVAVNGASAKTGVPADQTARFGARLINDSPTDEKRKYELRMLNESNPKGAIVRVNGAAISSGRPFYVEPGTASNLTITVERGVEAFDYDSLGVMTYAPCGFFPGARSPTLDTMYVSVEFEPPSSPIDLRTPNDGLALNRVTKEDSIDVRLQKFSMDTTDTGHRVSEIGVFYRPVTDLSQGLTAAKATGGSTDSTAADTLRKGRYFSGTAARDLFSRMNSSVQPKAERGLGALEDWSEIFVRARRDAVLAQNGCKAEDGCDFESIRDYFERTRFRDEDGVYELAAYTKTVTADGTVTGAYVSDPVRMAVDTDRPRVQGSPEPADGVLAEGDDIALTFDEDVDCETLRPNENVTLAYADSANAPIRTETTCDGRTVHLQPGEDALDAAEDETLVATVRTDTTDDGAVRRDAEGPVVLTDRVGNPLREDVAWRFAVQRSGLTWTPPTDTLEMAEGTTAQIEVGLVNYRSQPLRYRLKEASDALTVKGPTDETALLRSGESRTVQMTVEATREPGTYVDTVRAVGAGKEPARFRLRQVVTTNMAAALAPSNVAAAPIGRSQVEVRWAAPDSAVERYELYRGPTASVDTARAPLASLTTDDTRYVDTTAQAGRTHYYRLVGKRDDGLRSRPSPASEAFLYPSAVHAEAARTFSDGNSPRDYRLVALPGKTNRPLAQTVSGTPGEDWMAYWDDGSEKHPFISVEDADGFALRPGRGYWLRHDDRWTVEEQIPTVALDGDTVAVIDLHDGWNIISNPLGKTVPWRAVEAANGTDLQALWRFSGYYEPMPVFPSATTGEAFYFLNEKGLDSLAVPYPGAPFQRAPSAKRLATTEAPSATDSTLVLTTYRNGVRTSRAAVGIRTDAAKGLDAADQFAPPARFEGARLRMPTPTDTSEARRRLLAREVRPPVSPGQRVRLVLEAEPGTRVRIQARRVKALGAAAVRLVNRATGQVHDLRRRQSVEVEAEAARTNFVLLFGTTAYVEEAWSDITPPDVTLRPNYPNPARSQTTIEYAVPDPAPVRLQVYDVLGRRIANLVNSEKEAGWHRRTWSVQSVSSGVYFYRLHVGEETYTRKMVVVQ